jgi:hypothetical protein
MTAIRLSKMVFIDCFWVAYEKLQEKGFVVTVKRFAHADSL